MSAHSDSRVERCLDVPESWLRAAALGAMHAPMRGVLTAEQVLLGTQHLGASQTTWVPPTAPVAAVAAAGVTAP
jgi:hypothetical protein